MKNSYPAALQELIDGLKQLPGIGGRTAERLALAMLKWPPENLHTLGQAVDNLLENLKQCRICGNLIDADTECQICTDKSRNKSQICVIEEITQLYIIEKSNSYRGLYHILGGKLSPLNNRTEADLNIAALTARIESGEVEELILALGNDVESRATAFMLADKYQQKVAKITALAQGLPAGANLNYADSATITAALSHRHSIND